jgi:hypothetical protein
MIDDATSRVQSGFYEGETVEAHFDLLESRGAPHSQTGFVQENHDHDAQ